MVRVLVTVLLTVLATAVAATPAGATVIAQPGAATAVRELDGTIVYSAYDRGIARYRLTVLRAGASKPETLPVSTSRTPFDADIGTDTKGRPQLIYQRCSGGNVYVPTGCDLAVYSLEGGGGERPVRNANDPKYSDVAATLWRGRIAWVRVYGTQTVPNPVVYTKTLTAPRSQPSTRLPGVPQQRCGDVETNICGPTTGRHVDALELWGRNLAQVVGFGCGGCSGTGQQELRLADVQTRAASQVAFQVVGLSGQQLVGPSFFDGRLAWYRACFVDEPACRTFVGPWRFRISGRTYDRGPGGPRRVDGFADTGSSLYEVTGCNDDVGAVPEQPDCRIERVTPPTYTASPPPLR